MASPVRHAALACCFICACAGAPQSSPDTDATETGPDGNAANVDRRSVTAQADPSANTAGAGAKPHGDANANTAPAAENPENEAGSAGEGPTAQTTPASEEDTSHVSCEVNGTCSSTCGAPGKRAVTCGIESNGFACEFEGFLGATADVSCAERVVIGTACCGSCGCVPVEIYFDGTRCWQGMPLCQLPGFNGRLFKPHRTTEPNPSFTPPPSFYLGSGGFPGTEAADAVAGTPGIESAGRGSAGAAVLAASGSAGSSASGAGASADANGASGDCGGASTDNGGASTSAD